VGNYNLGSKKHTCHASFAVNKLVKLKLNIHTQIKNPCCKTKLKKYKLGRKKYTNNRE
jgi:hypothetical protein